MAITIDFIKSSQERLLVTQSKREAELNLPRKQQHAERIKNLSAYIDQLNEYIETRKSEIKDTKILLYVNNGIDALKRQFTATKNITTQPPLGQSYWFKEASKAEKAADVFFNKAKASFEKKAPSRRQPARAAQSDAEAEKEGKNILAKLRRQGAVQSVGKEKTPR